MLKTKLHCFLPFSLSYLRIDDNNIVADATTRKGWRQVAGVRWEEDVAKRKRGMQTSVINRGGGFNLAKHPVKSFKEFCSSCDY